MRVGHDVIFLGEDHYIDSSGTRWGLSCEWPSKATPVPECLQIDEARRRKAWEGVTLTNQWTGETQEDWQVRQDQLKAAQALIKSERDAKSLGALKDRHPGERYDKKLRAWVKITAPVMRETPPLVNAMTCPATGAACTLCAGSCMMTPASEEVA